MRIDLISLSLLIPLNLRLVYAYRSAQTKLTTASVMVNSDGNSEDGFRFIWRRPDGHLQAARGQARIPQRQDLEKLTKKAEDAGWY
ncbi:hypothetical protein LROSL1_p50001 (plasmid) [Furfurilactobacillus rossiae]|uniref:hypothetical protein n=1 Tax=Furfurilactobacillus rossiae TaxID=231049 RepID=UPI0015B85B2F|nr:hypothetical protein [Furfurilactobacillus rossiae]QLE62808.1 hypothetical protein LROSL1_p50001 [Furfurilactobacillus rossiae]